MDITYNAAIPNTFGLSVKADCMVRFSNESELSDVLAKISGGELKPPFLCLGEGSNMMFDGDFKGTVLISLLNDVAVMEETAEYIVLRVGSGYGWNDFTAYCASAGYFGVENLSGIPGTVGAAAVQNIGAYGAEASNLIVSVETVDLETGAAKSFSVQECGYAYRDSVFKKPSFKKYLVTHVRLRLSKVEHYALEYGRLREETANLGVLTPEKVRQSVISIRGSKLPDPSEVGSAGSFFKNPIVSADVYASLALSYPDMPHYPAPSGDGVKLSAAWLIERCGWKGRSLGKAAVWGKQPLVIVNTGGATASDIMNISSAVVNSVFEKFGIRLEKEVQFV
jgi:UDP-N-acetylmuramate dehydrogenase